MTGRVRSRPGADAEMAAALAGQIAVAAAGEEDLFRILVGTLQRLATFIPFTGGSIAIVEGDELVVRAAIGPLADQALGQRLARGRGQSWRLLDRQEPFRSGDVVAAGLVALSGQEAHAIRSWLGVPLVRRGTGIGLLEVDSPDVDAFDDAHESLLRSVAAVLSGPVELATRYEAEVRARSESQAAQRRLAILARIGAVLASSPQVEDTLSTIARFAVPDLADWCAVHLRGRGGQVRLVELAGPGADTGTADGGTGAGDAAARVEPELLPPAMRLGETVVVPDLAAPGDALADVPAWFRQVAAATGAGSLVSVPIRNGPTVAGALTFVTAASRPAFAGHDIALAEEIGRRASAALTNALLYARLLERERQQAAVAMLGQTALEGSELGVLFERAARLVADTLEHEYASILLVQPGQETLRRVAGVGWRELGVSEVVNLAVSSQIRYTLEAATPVVVEDLASEDRFPPSPTLLTAGVHGGVSVPIGRAPSLGVLTTHTLGRRPYREEDINFLSAVANVLASAIERERSREQEVKTDALRDAFIGVISHELRTPITTIYGSTKILTRPQSTLSDAQRREVLEDIEAEAERLRRLVEDLLVLSRAERGRVEVASDPVLISHVIARVVRSEEARWPAVTFTVSALADIPAVRGEETYVEQVLRNFVSNAAKYGGARGPVEIVAAAEGPFVAVRVLDRGPGIEATEADRLFELFYRSAATAAHASGAGIGLFVSRELVNAMGGSAWAVPRAGGGAEFGFKLPALGLDDE